MTQAETIRDFVNLTYIVPARTKGEKRVQVQAGKVHKEMNFKDKLPAVAAALGTNIFETNYRVKLIRRDGPQQGSTLTFTFEIQP